MGMLQGGVWRQHELAFACKAARHPGPPTSGHWLTQQTQENPSFTSMRHRQQEVTVSPNHIPRWGSHKPEQPYSQAILQLLQRAI